MIVVKDPKGDCKFPYSKSPEDISAGADAASFLLGFGFSIRRTDKTNEGTVGVLRD